MQIRIQKKYPRAVVPKRATVGAAGYDMTAVSMEATPTCFKYHTGVAFEIPPGYVGLVVPRSSVAKLGAWMSNSIGIIDSDYRGEVSFCFYTQERPKLFWRLFLRLFYGVKNGRIPPYNVGERVGQILIVKCETLDFTEAKQLSETERGDGGYGSTGR